jgi:hypothetical protein
MGHTFALRSTEESPVADNEGSPAANCAGDLSMHDRPFEALQCSQGPGIRHQVTKRGHIEAHELPDGNE